MEMLEHLPSLQQLLHRLMGCQVINSYLLCSTISGGPFLNAVKFASNYLLEIRFLNSHFWGACIELWHVSGNVNAVNLIL
jgi:hypothetical protein